MERLLTVNEFHELARIAVSTIYHLAAEEKIPHVRIGTRLFFDKTEIEKWLKANSIQAIGPTHSFKPHSNPKSKS